MGFSDDDRILIENLYIFKGYGAKKLIKEFLDKGWVCADWVNCWENFETPVWQWEEVGGRPRTGGETTDAVNDLVLSREDTPKTYRSTCQIARETGIHHSSVYRIVRKDLWLKCVKKRRAQELTAANRDPRLTRTKKLLRLYQQSTVDFIFSDEKIFTVAPPVNLQNWQRLRATVVKEARCCRWPTTPYTSNVQQVADGVGCRVQARVHGADFRPARG